ncbi:MAG: OmpH family outer membrane protein [Terriglobales bacterium]
MMRKLAVCIAVLGLAAVAVAQAGGAATAPAVPGPPAVKVGIINIQAAIAFSNEGQRDFAALQKKFEPKQNEITTLGKEIEDLKKQLQAQANVGSDESRASLARSIEQKQKLLQRTAEDARSDYTAQQNEVAGKIGNKMLGVLDTYAKNNGFAVVLNYDEQNPQNPVLWAGASVDITRPVLEAYNIVSGVPAPPPPAPSAAKPGAGAGAQAAPARPAASNPPPKPAGSNPPR